MSHTSSGDKITFLPGFIVSSRLLICGTYYCMQPQETSGIHFELCRLQ